MLPPLTSSGLLPPGRYRVTPAEVEQLFVTDAAFAASSTRPKVWADFKLLVELVRRQRVRVPAAFVGGGFTTDSLNPSDLDATLLFDASRISSQATYQKVWQILANTHATGLDLDAFGIPWFPDAVQANIQRLYLQERGKWDDWWQRHVPKANRQPPQRSHAMPIRGYLEVIFDDYS